MTRVLVVTSDPIGRRMAGPAIRTWNICRRLQQEGHEVRLVTTSTLEPIPAAFELHLVPPGRHRAFGRLERWAEVIVFQGHAMSMFRTLRRSRKRLVADIYDPMNIEQLEQAKTRPMREYIKVVSDRTELLNEQLLRADLLLAASDRQRLFYLGQLAGLGRVNPLTYGDDPDLARLLAVVPFGMTSEDPVATGPAMRDVVPGIAPDDKIVLWAGGLYDWFDPHTLIRAMATLAERRPNVRLFFQGTKHPGVPVMPVVASSIVLARELGVLDSVVFFNDSWVPYDERQNYLLEADLGVSTHGSHLETTLAFRTRILDYLWAGLPMVVTQGDSFGELVAREGLGEAVPHADPDALADALERVLFDDAVAADARAAVARVRERFRWEVVLQPLVDYVAAPWEAPDHALVPRESVVRARRVKHWGLRHDWRRFQHYLREGGLRAVGTKVGDRLRARSVAVRSEAEPPSSRGA
ncbi:MAG: glycosyltransferase family 4 protein [Actinomycetales bacterium]|nr:glycosyltransferase family 4 protein [Actinomycetales bacterium]